MRFLLAIGLLFIAIYFLDPWLLATILKINMFEWAYRCVCVAFDSSTDFKLRNGIMYFYNPVILIQKNLHTL